MAAAAALQIQTEGLICLSRPYPLVLCSKEGSAKTVRTALFLQGHNTEADDLFGQQTSIRVNTTSR